MSNRYCLFISANFFTVKSIKTQLDTLIQFCFNCDQISENKKKLMEIVFWLLVRFN